MAIILNEEKQSKVFVILKVISLNLKIHILLLMLIILEFSRLRLINSIETDISLYSSSDQLTISNVSNPQFLIDFTISLSGK
jgi:hypothetical protein